MNIIKKLTLRQLFLNKKRTLVTIFGVIIASSMMTAVSTSVASFQDLMQRKAINETGNWHIKYKNVPVSNVPAARDDKNTKKIFLCKSAGYALLQGSINKNKPYLHIEAYSQEGFKNMPIHLREGRLPRNSGELLISSHVDTNGGVAFTLGEKVSLELGERYSGDFKLDQDNAYFPADELPPGEIPETFKAITNQEYTIVGIMERPYYEWEPYTAPGYTAVTYMDESTLSKEEHVSVYVQLKKINNEAYTKGFNFLDISDNGGQQEDGYQTSDSTVNWKLLRNYGYARDTGMTGTIMTMSIILIFIIMVGGVSLIHNAFAISMSERSRYLGMLASVGATKKQKRGSVFFEGLVIGIIGIPIGILAGNLGMAVTFYLINPMLKNVMGLEFGIRVCISYPAIIAAAVFSALTIFISAYIPARRAARITPLEAIRQNKDVKLTKKAVKTSRLTKLLFGFEGEIALKNMKRNKKRYRAVIFSLFISLVLFLSVASYSYYMKKAFFMTDDSQNFDAVVHIYNNTEETIQTIKQSVELKESGMLWRLYNYDMDKEQSGNLMDDTYRRMMNETSQEIAGLASDSFQFKVMIYAMEDEALRNYAGKTGADMNRLLDASNPSVIVINQSRIRSSGNIASIPMLSPKKAGTLNLGAIDYQAEEDVQTFTSLAAVKVEAFTDELPVGLNYPGMYGEIKCVVSKPVFEKLAVLYNDYSQVRYPEENIDSEDESQGEYNVWESYRPTLYLKGKNPEKLSEALAKLQKANGTEEFYVNDYYASNQQERQMLLIVTIFAYGFIVLMTAICSANIFNGISTSIALRKREFATLKSVGMTPKAFHRMISFESLLYGLKALLWGLPAGFAMMYLIYRVLVGSFVMPFTVPWGSVAFGILIVFLVVGLAMGYSSSKIKKENLIESLKEENI